MCSAASEVQTLRGWVDVGNWISTLHIPHIIILTEWTTVLSALCEVMARNGRQNKELKGHYTGKRKLKMLEYSKESQYNIRIIQER